MIIVFDNDPMFATCMGIYFGNNGEPWIFPSDKVSSLNSAVKWLEQNVTRESIILVSANVSFQKAPDITNFEGLRLLRDMLLKRIPYGQLILYGLDSLKTLRKHGGKALFGIGFEKLFQYVKLPRS